MGKKKRVVKGNPREDLVAERCYSKMAAALPCRRARG